jgi:hypothetical protein
MANVSANFRAVPNRDGTWMVEIEWPDGSVQYVSEFKSDSEADDWITRESAEWLLKHAKIVR